MNFFKKMLILIGSRNKIIDNSGGLFSECIEIYKASKYRGAAVGDLILVTLKKVVPNKKIKKGDLAKALVVRTRSSLVRYSSHRVYTNDSAVILLNNNTLLPRAKRIRSLVLSEIRKSGETGLKALAIAPLIV